MRFIKCPKCQGKGKIGDKVCKKCKGRSLYAWYGGYFIYFQKIFKAGKIWAIRISQVLKVIIKIVLILVGIAGALMLLKVVIDNLNIFPAFLRQAIDFIP